MNFIDLKVTGYCISSMVHISHYRCLTNWTMMFSTLSYAPLHLGYVHIRDEYLVITGEFLCVCLIYILWLFYLVESTNHNHWRFKLWLWFNKYRVSSLISLNLSLNVFHAQISRSDVRCAANLVFVNLFVVPLFPILMIGIIDSEFYL